MVMLLAMSNALFLLQAVCILHTQGDFFLLPLPLSKKSKSMENLVRFIKDDLDLLFCTVCHGAAACCHLSGYQYTGSVCLLFALCNMSVNWIMLRLALILQTCKPSAQNSYWTCLSVCLFLRQCQCVKSSILCCYDLSQSVRLYTLLYYIAMHCFLAWPHLSNRK